MPRSTRKRINDTSEDAERPSAKRPRTIIRQYTSKVASAKRTRRTTLPKGHTQTQTTQTRRRSAPVKPSQYAPAGDQTGIEEDGKSLSMVDSQPRPVPIKSARMLVPTATVPEPQNLKAARLEQAVNYAFNRKPPTPPRSVDNEEHIKSVLRKGQLGHSVPNQMNYDGGFDAEVPQYKSNEVDPDEDLNEDLEMLSQIVGDLKFPKNGDLQRNGPSHDTTTTASYTITTNADTASRETAGFRAAKSISIPGRQDTPAITESRRSSRLRSKELLDTLVESQQEGADHGDGSNFQLKKRNNDEDEDEEEDEGSKDETPSPSGSKLENGQSARYDENALCLPPGYTRTRSRQNTAAHRFPLRPISPKGKRTVRTNSEYSQKTSLSKHTLGMRDAEESNDLRLRRPRIIDHSGKPESQNNVLFRAHPRAPATIKDFHALLLKKGIRCSFLEAGKEENVEDDHDCDTEKAGPDDESNLEDEMQDLESQYPEYQQNIRDALADFSEVFPHNHALITSTFSPNF